MLGKLKNWMLRTVVRRVASNQGLLDPFMVLDNLRRFSQPSEVAEPGELLRAGVVFHARGLMNRAIQYNDDWVWPYWAERQVDPKDESFMARAFSLTHINLTNRNWTGVGLPSHTEIPLVDPRGLVTPFYDGWSLDAWIVDKHGELLAPSREKEANQTLSLSPNLAVATETEKDGKRLQTQTRAEVVEGHPACVTRVLANSAEGGYLVLAVRPYNPEGIHFVYDIEMQPDLKRWKVNEKRHVMLSKAADDHAVSTYHKGDVSLLLDDDAARRHKTHCDVGMATAAALYRLEPGRERVVEAVVPIETKENTKRDRPMEISARNLWAGATENATQVEVPDAHLKFLTDASIRTLILHAPDENCYPGPFIYKRFWFRDAAFILQAMTAAGLTVRARRVLDSFPDRQTMTGHFLSQEGEWDSNGQALWVMQRHLELMGQQTPQDWVKSIHRAARWIHSKRRAETAKERPGLFPAGFSAEHLGLNDYYYWDDFWGVAGLEAAAKLLEGTDYADEVSAFRDEAKDFFETIQSYLEKDAERLGTPAMPAAPGRRLDAGAIGCMPPGYPLQLMEAKDPRLIKTVEYLMDRYFTDDAFLHHIGHSGFNAYLTLHCAQVLMRADDPRYINLIRAVMRLASPTGQWPEAVHPRTMGGCMGDGQHVWAAAEWFMTVRNMFAREEGNRLILGQGIPPEWLKAEEPLVFGPTHTDFGPLTVRITSNDGKVKVAWDAEWRTPPADIDVRLPGTQATQASADKNSIEIEMEPQA